MNENDYPFVVVNDETGRFGPGDVDKTPFVYGPFPTEEAARTWAEGFFCLAYWRVEVYEPATHWPIYKAA